MTVIDQLVNALQPFADQEVSKNSPCHSHICTPEKCGRCSEILAARAAIARADADGDVGHELEVAKHQVEQIQRNWRGALEREERGASLVAELLGHMGKPRADSFMSANDYVACMDLYEKVHDWIYRVGAAERCESRAPGDYAHVQCTKPRGHGGACGNTFAQIAW